MYYIPGAAARLYRMTAPGSTWPTPLFGHGAYFTKGGRFNRANDPTVYCSEDPLVVITETAFYEALEWHRRISDHRLNPVGYPFVSRHSFWCFSIDPPPPLIDLQHSSAIAQFQFPPHMLLNPALNPRRGLQLAGQSAARDYFGTQELADEIRAFIPPAGSPNPRPEGIRAPSVRTAAVSGYQPSMLALFFFDPKLGWVPYENRASLIAQWDLVLEFLEVSTDLPVNYATLDIDWRQPRFHLEGAGAQKVPAYGPAPGGMEVQPNQCYRVSIRYA